MANPNPTPKPENLTPWKPGQSGNPAGHSKARRITGRLIRMIEEEGADEDLARTWLEAAKGGDPRFFAMLLDRVEGKVGETKGEPDEADEPPATDGTTGEPVDP